MDRWLLMWTRDNLMSWVHKASEETVPDSKKLTLIMMSLADICSALARETEYEKVPGYKDGESNDED